MQQLQIDSFRNEYGFLSNFHACSVTWDGDTYPSSEHAFQAAKVPRDKRRPFKSGSAGEVKKLGRSVQLPRDRESRSYSVMREVVEAKFRQNPDLCYRLLLTYDAKLIEGNTWGDDRFGCVWLNGGWVGKNWLGKILMEVRALLRTEAEARGEWPLGPVVTFEKRKA